ncbi:MAG: CBS domain-containing protein [Oscillospiraceae bacterium]
MNILFFLTPKNDVAFLYDDFTLRQALEKMEHHRYSSIPILNRKGEYVGTITEGDILWAVKSQYSLSIRDAENMPITQIPHKRDNTPVHVDTTMEELVFASMSQNFVPVIDDKNSFIGIVRRKDIIQYCYDKAQPANEKKPHTLNIKKAQSIH